jgi:hypothetical protein
MIEVTAAVLAGHPFLRGMPPGQLDALAAAASDVTFPARHRIFDDGGFAARFWLIQSGHVALDVHVPGSGRVTIDSIGIGDLLGWLLLAVPAVPVGVRRGLPHPGAGVRIRRGRHPRTVYGRPGIRRRAPPAAAAGTRQTAAGHQDPADRQDDVRRRRRSVIASPTPTGYGGRSCKRERS